MTFSIKQKAAAWAVLSMLSAIGLVTLGMVLLAFIMAYTTMKLFFALVLGICVVALYRSMYDHHLERLEAELAPQRKHIDSSMCNCVACKEAK